jgi:biotin carboxyl carrier protein
LILEIDVNGRSRTVTVERVGGAAANAFLVHMDGQRHIVDAVRLGDDSLSLILTGAGGLSRDIGFSETEGQGQVSVHLAGGAVDVTVNGRRARRSQTLQAGGGQARIVAPMPGRVLRVLVAVGDQVAARQPLVVVEAMKMENELSSLRPGRVTEVAVVAGQSVEAGRQLAVVE